MKITVHCKNADSLLKKIKSRLNSEESKTWEIKLNANDEPLFNHSPNQWSEKVLLKPSKVDNGLLIETKYWRGRDVPAEEIKGYVIGRFVEVLMVHFRKEFDFIEVS
ncbi:hypothetical protein [Chryseobacterium sp.]|uniref:hypothetical protein n=1 Tax=Chryseobacterium sp. TaxID=1871047 RepID=UPI0031DF362F